MVAADDRHRVEAKAEEAVDRRAHADLGDIPGIGVDGFVAHRMLSCQNPRRRAQDRPLASCATIAGAMPAVNAGPGLRDADD